MSLNGTIYNKTKLGETVEKLFKIQDSILNLCDEEVSLSFKDLRKEKIPFIGHIE